MQTINWYVAIVRPLSRKLEMIFLNRHYNTPEASMYHPEEVESLKEQYYKDCLPKIDRMLAEKNYLCSNGMMPTIADLIVFNEISQVIYLEGAPLRKDLFPNLYKWFKQISKLKEVDEVNMKVEELLHEENFND
jgi:glutathione S-transferase